MLTREPDNPADPNAVRVTTLAGRMLGYVPRDLTSAIQQDSTFGHVHSLGQAVEAPQYWGVLVSGRCNVFSLYKAAPEWLEPDSPAVPLGTKHCHACLQIALRPSLPPLTLEAFPARLAGSCNMSSELQDRDWDRLRKAAYTRAKHKWVLLKLAGIGGAHNFQPACWSLRAAPCLDTSRDVTIPHLRGRLHCSSMLPVSRCEVTGGVGQEWPVECHEQWRFHEDTQTAELMNLVALHPDVHLAKHLERQQDDRKRQQALWMLQAINE